MKIYRLLLLMLLTLNIQSVMAFEGNIGDSNVGSDTNDSTLNRKPVIKEIDIVSYTPSSQDKGYCDIVVEIHYTGAQYLHASVEEENSSLTRTFYSDNPEYAKFTITDVDTWGKALIHVTASNQYGSDTMSKEIFPQTSGIENTQQDKLDIRIENGILHLSEKVKSLYIFTAGGQIVARHKNTDRVQLNALRHGVYIIQTGNLRKKFVLQ